MIDQDAFRKTYNGINDRVCVFEKAVLSRKCSCDLAKKLLIAEREGIHCTQDEGQARCMEFISKLRHHARFALRINDFQGVLPHGKAIKLQVGGLRGLYLSLNPEHEDPPSPIEGVSQLLTEGEEKFSGFDELPIQAMIQQIAAYQARPKLTRK